MDAVWYFGGRDGVTMVELASASNMIGKSVQGLDDNNDPISGVVNSVQVAGNNVNLQLDTGKTLSLAKVSSVAPGPTGTQAATTPAAPTN